MTLTHRVENAIRPFAIGRKNWMFSDTVKGAQSSANLYALAVMWLFFRDSFLSVVAHRKKKNVLLVRARFQGDIERIFPGVKVAKTPSADYAFRVEVTRERVAQALTQEAMDMDYDNLKGAVDETFRHDVMMEVWAKMLHAQNSQLDAAAG